MVIRTGIGKSLCFMLPAASYPGGLTVMIVPLVSLQGNLMCYDPGGYVTCTPHFHIALTNEALERLQQERIAPGAPRPRNDVAP
jgi:hypothetical protein